MVSFLLILAGSIGGFLGVGAISSARQKLDKNGTGGGDFVWGVGLLMFMALCWRYA